MQIGIPLETRAGEARVAATPETVKKYVAQGHQVLVQSGAGVRASCPDAAYEAAGASIVDAARAFGAELVLKVRSPRSAGTRADSPRRHAGRHARSVRRRQQRPHGRRRHRRLRARGSAAHDPRAKHGRAVLAGKHRRLQGRAGRRQPLSTLHADADDRRRYGQGRARADPRRRRGRPAGNRHRQAARRGDRGLRRAARGQGTDRIAGREVSRRAVRNRRGARDRAGRRRLCAADAGKLDAAPGRAGARAREAGRYRHHHRADPPDAARRCC
ncbi:hypothetical protein OJJOAM_002365 [Cupriavidus sp. H18C1]